MIGWRFFLGFFACVVSGAVIFLVFYYQGQASRGKETTHAEHQQAENNAEAAKTIDHYSQTTTIIRERADAVSATIQSASGADTPIPDAVLYVWRTGLDGLREQPPAANDPPS